MGNAIVYLFETATCAEVNNAISGVGQHQTKNDTMLVLAYFAFQEGYAKGKGISSDESNAEILSFCIENPDAKFSDL